MLCRIEFSGVGRGMFHYGQQRGNSVARYRYESRSVALGNTNSGEMPHFPTITNPNHSLQLDGHVDKIPTTVRRGDNKGGTNDHAITTFGAKVSRPG